MFSHGCPVAWHMKDTEEASGSDIGTSPYSCFHSASRCRSTHGSDGCWLAVRTDGAFPQKVSSNKGQHRPQTWGNTVTGVVKPCHNSGSGRRSRMCVVWGNESIRRNIVVSQEMICNRDQRPFLPTSIIVSPPRASEDHFDSTTKISKVQVLTPL